MIAESESEPRQNLAALRQAEEREDWVLVDALIEQRAVRGWPIPDDARLRNPMTGELLSRAVQTRVLARRQLLSRDLNDDAAEELLVRIEAESATGGGPVWKDGLPPPDRPESRMDPELVRAAAHARLVAGTPPSWAVVTELTAGVNRQLSATDAVNVLEAIRMRSDVDAHVLQRLIGQVAGLELLLGQVIRGIAPIAGYVEASTGPYARWVCTTVIGAGVPVNLCESRGRWVYTGGTDNRILVVTRGLGEHLNYHVAAQRSDEAGGP